MSRRGVADALVTLIVVALAPTLVEPGATGVRPSAFPSLGKIKHIIVIYQENRSFDEVLGAFCLQNHRCDGKIGPVKLKGGLVVSLTQSPDVVSPDPPHESKSQLQAIDGGKMDGWGNLAAQCHSPGTNVCLTYYLPSQVPALTALAQKYVVSDRTFSMQDSASYGGHIYAAAATQDGFNGDTPNNVNIFTTGWGCDTTGLEWWVSPSGAGSWQPACIPAPHGFLDPVKYPYDGAWKPTLVPNVPTIFDRLDHAHLSWKLYTSVKLWSICPQFAECFYGPQRTHMVAPTQILTDAKNGALPAYSVLLPTGPGGIIGGTGQHPPGSMLVGDNWIARVVKAVQASPQWSSTAIFITYDDCGCFYDHVPPGHNPDGTLQGIREPMVIISPYAKVAGTDSTQATFASILHFAEETFGLAPLGVNDAQGYDYANAFNFSAAPTAPRVWPHEQPIPAATMQLLARVPIDPNDPT